MTARVQQHVTKRVPDLTRRLQGAHMIAVGKHRPTASEHTIDRSGEPGTNGNHPARQRRSVVGLDEQMNVVRLHGEVRDPKVSAFARPSQAPRELVDEAPRAKRRNVRANPKRDVRGMPRHQGRT